jgi:alpha-galactosidase
VAELVEWGNAAILLRLSIDDGIVRIVNVGPAGHLGEDVPLHAALNPVELQFAGDELPQGSRHVQLGGTAALRYRSHAVERSKLTLVQFDPRRKISVSTTWRVFGEIAAIRSATVVTNEGSTTLVLEYLSSLSFNGFADFADRGWETSTMLAIGNNTFCGEFQWVEHSLPSLGINDVGFQQTGVHSTKKRIAITSIGTNPTAEYLPMGAIEDRRRGVTWAWQIEHSGSWHWEVGDHLTRVYLTAGGPTDQEHHWREVLAAGDSFESVPVALVAVAGNLADAFAPLTAYRRAIRRTSDDNRDLPVVFNDYMNALVAEPTEAKLLPVIAAAAQAGSEYFCVDAGWYSDQPDWWKTVGEWRESAARFPNGFVRVFDEIRAQGMIPGLWIEPEVVGVDSPAASELPDSAFFMRNGARVNAAGRYQLDFRSPLVIERMDAVIHRIVTAYGLGYLKFDYNVNGGVGTDRGSSSSGTGLLAHNRAYLAWVDALLERYPNLVIEACASGGGRADYATLRRHSITSTSDQTDSLRSVAIAAAAATAITPEQAGVWVYPQPEFSEDEFDLSIVNGLLARPQLSGGIWKLSHERLERLAQAVRSYKGYRSEIAAALPFWPIGLPGWSDDWIAHGLNAESGTYISVWRRGGGDSIVLPGLNNRGISVIFPPDSSVTTSWEGKNLIVRLPRTPSAVLLKIA